MSYALGLMVESIVAVLLLLTIGYCALLNRQLRQLKADEPMLKRSVAELANATDMAVRAVAGLKSAAAESELSLGEQLKGAEQLAADLQRQIATGEALFDRLARIAMATRPQPQPVEASSPAEPVAADEPRPAEQVDAFPTHDSKAMVAAAQAFADRARLRQGDRAA